MVVQRIFKILVIASVPLIDGFSTPRITKSSETIVSRRPSIFPNSQDVSPKDIDVFVRQTGQTKPGDAAIGVPINCQCRHDFAQVFTLDPLPNDRRMNSGLLKLTCPLLVRAVDDLEDAGFIAQFNAKLLESDTVGGESKLQKAMRSAHQTHASVRMELLQTNELREVLDLRLGHNAAKSFLSAGVAGASSEAVSDVKCLHAWLGDYLFRGADASPLGAMVAEILIDRGIDLHGRTDCQRYCDPLSSLAASPPTPRNKQRLKTTKERTRRLKNKIVNS